MGFTLPECLFLPALYRPVQLRCSIFGTCHRWLECSFPQGLHMASGHITPWVITGSLSAHFPMCYRQIECTFLHVLQTDWVHISPCATDCTFLHVLQIDWAHIFPCATGKLSARFCMCYRLRAHFSMFCKLRAHFSMFCRLRAHFSMCLHQHSLGNPISHFRQTARVLICPWATDSLMTNFPMGYG